MIKPAQLEEVAAAGPILGHHAGQTVAYISDPKKRPLIWFLHWRSHQPGGLKRFCYELINRNLRARLGSETMHRIGFNPSTVYAGQPFEDICNELSFFPSGARNHLEWTIEIHASIFRGLEQDGELAKAKKLLSPESRRASAATFLNECRDLACSGLAHHIRNFCSDHSAKWEVRYLHDLVGAITEMMKDQADFARSQTAETKIASNVSDTLEFSYRTRGLVVIYGIERIGKTKAAERWVAMNPDKARLIRLTATTNDLLFFSEVAEAIGCGDMRGQTVGEMRDQIRGTVKSRDLMLIFDEAHCLFGLSPKGSIKRLEYIRTELVNNDIPVALIITPQFANRLAGLERSTDFNLNQFRGRVTKWAELPAKPSRADIESIARFGLPEIDDKCLALLADSAAGSEFPLAALHNAILEAKTIIEKNGSAITLDLVKQAVGFAMWTTARLAETIPAPASKTTKRRNRVVTVDTSMSSRASGDGLQAASPAVAGRLQSPGNDTSLTAAQSPDRGSMPGRSIIPYDEPISSSRQRQGVLIPASIL
ncbi:MAG TPA: ATP-binding protein [Opitutaceae bacterium]|jgi:hypothetical protein|nr:ATP-binding protein [Opitutaceae bacterium]